MTTRREFVLAGIMLAMFMVAIEATIVATAMPDIVRRLGGFSLYSWVFAGFLLSQTATTVVFGKLSDIYGRRPVLVFCMRASSGRTRKSTTSARSFSRSR